MVAHEVASLSLGEIPETLIVNRTGKVLLRPAVGVCVANAAAGGGAILRGPDGTEQNICYRT